MFFFVMLKAGIMSRESSSSNFSMILNEKY
jgi:hypothetical protein